MKTQDPLHALRALIDSVRVGILATVAPDGHPHLRWITAATLPQTSGCLYAASSVDSPKAAELDASDRVQWSFQSPGLDEIITVRGRASVLDNPALKGEVLEALGPNLSNFWRAHPDPACLVVIETVIDQIRLFRPMEGLDIRTEVPS